MDLLYDCVGAIGVRAQEVRETNSVNLIDGSRPALHLSCRHINNDEVAAIQIEDGESASSAGVHANNFHGVSIYSPFNFVSPEGRRHFAFGNILGVTSLERLVPR